MPAKKARMYSREGQRQVDDYWRGDWLTLGAVMRIIGTYDAINAKTANLGTSSINRSGWHSMGGFRRGVRSESLPETTGASGTVLGAKGVLVDRT